MTREARGPGPSTGEGGKVCQQDTCRHRPSASSEQVSTNLVQTSPAAGAAEWESADSAAAASTPVPAAAEAACAAAAAAASAAAVGRGQIPSASTRGCRPGTCRCRPWTREDHVSATRAQAPPATGAAVREEAAAAAVAHSSVAAAASAAAAAAAAAVCQGQRQPRRSDLALEEPGRARQVAGGAELWAAPNAPQPPATRRRREEHRHMNEYRRWCHAGRSSAKTRGGR